MDIFSVRIEGWQEIILTINWFAAIMLTLVIMIVAWGVKWIYNKVAFKTVKIEETTIGIGNSSVTIRYDGSIKEIAYKIWIELTTRKIGIKFDEEHDVIVEVYDSWYEAFKVIRTLLKDIPANRIDDAKGLIELTTKVLNVGLRPHLTKWQAKYRKWYSIALEQNDKLSPQEIQKKFPEYQLLVDDLKYTNDIMMKYSEELKKLIDNE